MNITCEREVKEAHILLLKAAKAIRVITVPPLMVAALLTVLFFSGNVFLTAGDYLLTLLLLAVVPALAYPVQQMVPMLRKGGRPVQRKLAFIFSIFSYGAAVAFDLLRNASADCLFITGVYFASVLILTLLNKWSPWRASGHACSIAGPILLICLFVGWYAIPVGIVLYAAAFWASVYMKRHTASEFLFGTLSAVLAAVICYFLISPVL